MKLFAVAIAGASFAACGMDAGFDENFDHEHEADGSVFSAVTQSSDKRYTVADVQAWDGSATLGENKRALIAAATKLGATDEQVRLFLAIGMAETNQMNACDRDISKDGAGLARNMTAFNMNCDMLCRLGWVEGAGPDLNCQTNIDEVAKYLMAAVNKFGMDGFLYFHRGGATALVDGESYGAQEYKSAMRAVADRLAANRQDMSNNRRVGMSIQHV